MPTFLGIVMTVSGSLSPEIAKWKAQTVTSNSQGFGEQAAYSESVEPLGLSIAGFLTAI